MWNFELVSGVRTYRMPVHLHKHFGEIIYDYYPYSKVLDTYIHNASFVSNDGTKDTFLNVILEGRNPHFIKRLANSLEINGRNINHIVPDTLFGLGLHLSQEAVIKFNEGYIHFKMEPITVDFSCIVSVCWNRYQQSPFIVFCNSFNDKVINDAIKNSIGDDFYKQILFSKLSMERSDSQNLIESMENDGEINTKKDGWSVISNGLLSKNFVLNGAHDDFFIGVNTVINGNISHVFLKRLSLIQKAINENRLSNFRYAISPLSRVALIGGKKNERVEQMLSSLFREHDRE